MMDEVRRRRLFAAITGCVATVCLIQHTIAAIITGIDVDTQWFNELMACRTPPPPSLNNARSGLHVGLLAKRQASRKPGTPTIYMRDNPSRYESGVL
jgi:hypothetical protein